MNLVFFIYVAGFLAFFGLTEIFKRRFDIKSEVTRKVVHFGSSVLIVSMPFYLDKYQVIMLAVMFVLLLAVTRRFNLFLAVQGVKRKTIGEFTFAASAGVAALMFLPLNPAAFILGFVVLGVSDTAAQICGEHFPIRKIKVLSQTKSLGGFLGFVIVTGIILFTGLIMVQYEFSFLRLALVCLILGFVEVSQVFGFDNLFIPACTGLLWELVLTNG